MPIRDLLRLSRHASDVRRDDYLITLTSVFQQGARPTVSYFVGENVGRDTGKRMGSKEFNHIRFVHDIATRGVDQQYIVLHLYKNIAR